MRDRNRCGCPGGPAHPHRKSRHAPRGAISKQIKGKKGAAENGQHTSVHSRERRLVDEGETVGNLKSLSDS